MTRTGSPDDPLDRLGYALTRVQARYVELVTDALRPLSIGVLDWAALVRFGDGVERSQAEIGRLLGVDRTSMVALVDHLEHSGLVERRPHESDRRKNAVVLTAAGRDLARRATALVDECERELLAPLSERADRQLRASLRAVAAAADEG